MNTKELKELFDGMAKHVSFNKNLEEVYHCFIFDKDRVIVLNDNYALEKPFNSGIQAIVPAEEVTKIFTGMESESVTFKLKKGNLEIKAKGVRAEVTCYDWDKEILEMVPALGKKKWKKLPENFNEAVKLCMFSASKDSSSRFNVVSVKDNFIQSTDNMRISRYEMDKEIKPFLLPLVSATSLSRLKSSHYFIEDNWTYFKNEDGSIMRSRIIEDDFPEVESLFKVSKKENFPLPPELAKILPLVSIFVEGEFLMDQKITVSIKDGVMKCRSENSAGWIESDIKLKTKKNISFFINPFFFAEILKLSTSAVLDDKKIIFTSGNFVHLMALID